MVLDRILKKLVYPFLLFALCYVFYNSVKDDYIDIFTARAFNNKIKVHPGDSTIWKKLTYDDSSWVTDLPPVPYFAWMRTTVFLDSSHIQNTPLGLGLWSYTGAYELFWDEVAIGRNGVPGLDDNEIPGVIDKIFHIPDSLMYAGSHLISLRASQQKSRLLSSKPYIIIESYDMQSKSLIVIAAFIHILSGVFLIISLYYFLVYFKSYRQLIFILFGIICLTLFASSLLQFVKFYYKYPYPFHFIRRITLDGLAIVLGISLVSYFLLLYEIKKPLLYISGLATIFTISVFINQENNLTKIHELFGIGILFSLYLTIQAVYIGKKNSVSSLYSLVAPFTLLFFQDIYFFELMIYVSFFIFIVINLYTLSKTIGLHKREYEKYLIESNRLKIELLKKNIQPHFIMNTLTSLISWVEESPSVAVKFIEALADEFRILVEIAENDRISIDTEIQLCKTHIKVMSYRHDVEYCLKSIDIDSSQFVPPAIFLTMLENGITHNTHETEKVTFELKFTKSSSYLTYYFFSPGISTNAPNKDGTGMKYIKARLNELYRNSWQLESYQANGGWETKLMLIR